MSGLEGATSPHETYCLMHGPGTVRSGKWKYYPWREGSDKKNQRSSSVSANRPPVQLYDTVADISETTNVATEHPEVVERLQAAWETHRKELQANRRPNADLIRPAGSHSPDRPGSKPVAKQPPKRPSKPIDWTGARIGKTYPTHAAANLVSRPFEVGCTVRGEGLRGVLIAHGGSVTGYSLYVRQGQVVFALRRTDSSIHRVQLPIVSSAEQKIVAKAEGKQLTLRVNDRVITAESAGLLLKHPSENVAIGFDDRMPVDPQSPQEKFNGALSKINVSPGER